MAGPGRDQAGQAGTVTTATDYGDRRRSTPGEGEGAREEAKKKEELTRDTLAWSGVAGENKWRGNGVRRRRPEARKETVGDGVVEHPGSIPLARR